MNAQTPRHGEIGELTGLRRREAKRIDVEGARWLCAQVAFGYSFAVADDLTGDGEGVLVLVHDQFPFVQMVRMR